MTNITIKHPIIVVAIITPIMIEDFVESSGIEVIVVVVVVSMMTVGIA